MSFVPPVGAATSSTRGLVKLAGDLGGTADIPTVPGLASKANTTDVYTKAQVDASISAKADTSALSGYIPTTQVGASNGVASLDSSGKLVASQLQVTFPVTTVAGRTGDVTLAKADVGLGNVDNISDANKPVSTATQTALSGKANTVHTHVISDVTSLQSSLDAKANASDMTTALAGKAALSHTHLSSDISDSTAVGRAVLTATNAAAAQSALAIANTVQVVNAFSDVTTPVYGTLYVVRA